MAWNDVTRLGKALFQKHTGGPEPTATPDVPLQARIGSVVKIQQTPFIRAEVDGSLVQAPTPQEDRIVAISRVKLGEAGDLYRFFLATEETAPCVKFLQVYRTAQGHVSDMEYFSSLTSFVPETAEDQDLFTGRSGHGLGDREYQIWREQVVDALPDQVLAAAFANDQPLTFVRDSGGDAEFTKPYQVQETRVETANGEQGLNQEVFFVPYRRQVGQTSEALLIATQVVSSADGDDSKRSITVWFYSGVPVEMDRVQIL
jgi:hypothetical protein